MYLEALIARNKDNRTLKDKIIIQKLCGTNWWEAASTQVTSALSLLFWNTVLQYG